MVGERGFEPPTSASRTLRANQAALLPEEPEYHNQVSEAQATRSNVLRPLMHSPWIEEPPGPERPVPKGFWRKVGQFLFDYNRY